MLWWQPVAMRGSAVCLYVSPMRKIPCTRGVGAGERIAGSVRSSRPDLLPLSGAAVGAGAMPEARQQRGSAGMVYTPLPA